MIESNNTNHKYSECPKCKFNFNPQTQARCMICNALLRPRLMLSAKEDSRYSVSLVFLKDALKRTILLSQNYWRKYVRILEREFQGPMWLIAFFVVSAAIAIKGDKTIGYLMYVLGMTIYTLYNLTS